MARGIFRPFRKSSHMYNLHVDFEGMCASALDGVRVMSCWLNSLNKFCHVFLQENSAAILCTAGFRLCAPCYFKQQGQLALRVCDWDGRETRSNALHVLKPKLLGGPGLVGTHSCRTQADHIIGPELESVAELRTLLLNS